VLYKRLKNLAKNLHNSLTHFVYPAHCLYCHNFLPPAAPVLCHSCASELKLLDPIEHCQKCFNFNLEANHPICHECLQRPSLFNKVGAAFNYEGPAAELVKQLKYYNQSYLAQGMAAFLVLQFDLLKWPLPDLIVPVPISKLHAIERGYNQSALLAVHMQKMLKVSIDNKALSHRSNTFSQSSLTLVQRKNLATKSFVLNKKANVTDKIILLIDDVMTSGLTLQRCAEALSAGGPKSIYGLTFCHTSP